MNKLKVRLKNTDWWEFTYLLIYGGVFTFEFLNTTMFGVDWPPRFAFIFMGAIALYTIAKFIWHNTYTRKEMIWSGIILFAFIMPAILTDYSFLWCVGFLIVAAKDIDFNKILKVYLVLGITIMVAAFGASQYGMIEDLEYVIERGGKVLVRHSYGIIYPTDFAAHIFYMVLAAVVYMRDRLSVLGRVWLSMLAAGFVYLVANAQTSMLCLVGFAVLCVFEHVFQKYMKNIGKVVQWTPVVCAGGFIGISYMYDPASSLMSKLNILLSRRLDISRMAFDEYDVKLFGQNVFEVGFGGEVGDRIYYFFLDDAYVRILFKYGIVLLLIMLMILVYILGKCNQKKETLMVVVIIAIAIHSIMEHHLLELAYNPFILALFVCMNKCEQTDRRKKCIENVAKAG